jgi:hypothetical protein
MWLKVGLDVQEDKQFSQIARINRIFAYFLVDCLYPVWPFRFSDSFWNTMIETFFSPPSAQNGRWNIIARFSPERNSLVLEQRSVSLSTPYRSAVS